MTQSHETPSRPSQSFIHICQMMLSPYAGEAGHSQVVEYSRLKWFGFFFFLFFFFFFKENRLKVSKSILFIYFLFL